MAKKRRRVLPLSIVLVILLLLSLHLVRLQSQIAEAKQTAQELQVEVEDLTRANEKLENEIFNAGDEKLMKNIASVELGLVEEGEKVFRDTNR